MTLPAFTKNTWELDGITFNTGPNESGFAYLVKTSKGWKGAPARRPQLADRPDAHGSYRGPNYQASRVIQLTGIAQCSRRADRDALTDSLEGLCRDPYTLFGLTRHEFDRSLTAWVELNDTIDVTELPDGCTVLFDIQLVASDPRKFSSAIKTAETGIAQAPLDGILWNGTPGNTGIEWSGPDMPVTGLVYQASSGVSGVLALDNEGTAETPILFTINGPATGTLPNPTITDTGRGYVISYGGTLVNGDVLTIDTGTGEVTLNGSSASGQLTRADLFDIPAGDTVVIQFSASGPADSAVLTARWSDAY